MFKLRIVFVYALILLAACTNQPQSGNTNITIGVTMNLSAYRSTIYHCSQASMQSVKVDALPLETLLAGEYDVLLQVGLPDADRLFPIQVGTVKPVFIINPQNPLNQLTSSGLVAILLGLEDDWQEVSPENFSTPTPIQVWSYPRGDDARQMVESLLLDERLITPRSLIAPDNKAMIEAVSKNPAALGFLLDIHPYSDVKSLQVIPVGEAVEDQPIIASFLAIPEGDLKNILICLTEQGK